MSSSLALIITQMNSVHITTLYFKKIHFIIVLNVHAPSEVKRDDMKDSLYEELYSVLDQFAKYDMIILLRIFNVTEGTEKIFKPTNRNESLHEISKDNGVRVVKFSTQESLIGSNTTFPHRNIHKYTLTSLD